MNTLFVADVVCCKSNTEFAETRKSFNCVFLTLIVVTLIVVTLIVAFVFVFVFVFVFMVLSPII